jgi:hypothetical protein
MEQTFKDLYEERKRQTEQGLFGFVLWTFVETATGIAKEHMLLIREGNTLKNIFTNLRWPAIISSFLVLPLAILEFTFNTVNKANAPGLTLLFGLLWLLPTAFIATLVPIVRNVRAGNSILANPTILLLKVAFLALIAMMWGAFYLTNFPVL